MARGGSVIAPRSPSLYQRPSSVGSASSPSAQTVLPPNPPNRRVRTRTHGGVGGGTRESSSYPIFWGSARFAGAAAAEQERRRMVAERDARQAAIVIVMDTPVTALRTRWMLLGRLMVAPAGAALVAVEMRLLLDRQRQRDAGFQHGVAADLAFRMRHHRINDLFRLALALFLLLTPAVVTAAATARFAPAGQGRAFQAFDRDARDRGAHQLLDRSDIFAVDRRRQREGVAFAAGPAGAADPVDVVLSMHRHVETEDVAKALDVETAGGDVAAYHQAHFALLELVERLGTGRLRHVAMQAHGIEAVLGERLEQDLHVALAIAENEGVGDVLPADQLAQSLALLLRFHHHHALHDGRGRSRRRGYADLLRIHQERVGQPADFRRHGGGEEQGLAQLRQQPDDLLDIPDETHVEHAVGFVDHQDLDVVHQDLAALEQIDQAAGRGDQHVDAAIQLLLLVDKALATYEQGVAQVCVLAILLEAVGHLGRQLPSRLQDQGARHAGLGPAAAQDLDHGQGETSGLSGAGLGTAQNVAAHKNHWNRLGLDGGGLLIADFGDRLQDSGA